MNNRDASIRPSRPRPGIRRFIVGLSAGLALLATAATSPSGAAPEGGVVRGRIADQADCRIEIARQAGRKAIAVGQTLELELRYGYDCGQSAAQPIDIFFLVENSPWLRNGGGNRNALPQVKAALSQFLESLDLEASAMAGLMLYTREVQTKVRFGQGERTAQQLQSAINSLNSRNDEDSAGIPKAIKDATSVLSRQGRPDASKLIVLIDAGAPVATQPEVTFEEACPGAAQAGVTLAVLGLYGSEGRGVGCAQAGWFYQSQERDASDLPGLMAHLQSRVLVDRRLTGESYRDEPYGELGYVAGSAEPAEPFEDAAGGLEWSLDPDGQRTGERAIRYRLQALPGSGRTITPISLSAGLTLSFADGSQQWQALEPAEICIYEPEDPSFCVDYLPATPTGMPPSLTATPEPSPTRALPSPEPSPTAENPRTSIYLPLLHQPLDGALASQPSFRSGGSTSE